MEFRHRLPDTTLVHARHPFIVERCRGKSVLHIGCVDAGLLEQRFAHGELLHQKLLRVAPCVIGTDIDAEGIRFLRQHGIEDVHLVDVSDENAELPFADRRFDVIVLSEVIEHVLDPGRMLKRLMHLMQPETTQLLVTVPNAFTVNNLLHMARGVEYVHPDHNYYFSRATLRNLLLKSGLRIAEELLYTFETEVLPARIRRRVQVFDEPAPAAETFDWMRRTYWRLRALPHLLVRRIVAGYLYGRTPYWADGLIAVCYRPAAHSTAQAVA
jgi:2-polyprenyl-3-methyl-5-hydroxy-6-metoxy-1,4-benzoquinol methylase